jgi:hypothetical protein
VLREAGDLVGGEYRTDEQAWLQNVLRTGLLHLQGSGLRDCVTSCARFAPFACAIATVLSEPWHAPPGAPDHRGAGRSELHRLLGAVRVLLALGQLGSDLWEGDRHFHPQHVR